MPVLAVCPVHGPFPSRAFPLTNSRGVTFEGVTESCPVPGCRRLASLIDGTYDFDADGLATILSAPGWGRRALRSVQDTVQELAEAAEVDDVARYDEVLRRLERQDQQLAHLVAAGTSGKPTSDIVAVLTKVFAVLGAVITLRETGGLTAEAVKLIVDQFFSGS